MPGSLVAALVLFVLLQVVIIRSVKVLNENQRGVVFRLGRFQRIVGPGLIVIVPGIDRLYKIDLSAKVSGWQGLSKDQLEAKVKEIALIEFK